MRKAVLLIIVAVIGTLIANAANDSIRKRILDSYVSYGEKYIGCRWESPNATLFAEFKTNGNRTRYELWTFSKRRQLAALVLAEKRGVISLGSCSLYYPKSKCSVVVEPLSESLDPMLRTMWPDGLWRIVVTAINKLEKDKLVFTITP